MMVLDCSNSGWFIGGDVLDFLLMVFLGKMVFELYGCCVVFFFFGLGFTFPANHCLWVNCLNNLIRTTLKKDW